MRAEIIKIDPDNVDESIINKAAELIDSGKMVVFPTETVYGIACRCKNDSIKKLDYIKSRSTLKPYTLHIGRQEDINLYVPVIGLKASKIIQKAWPGPLTVVFELDTESLQEQKRVLKKEVFDLLYKNNTIGIRCPKHTVASMLLQKAKSPIVAPSANLSGFEPAINAQAAIEQLLNKVDMIIDAGECRYSKSSTVVKIGKKQIDILREGFYSKQGLENISKINFLFVCTGNTCRSPMAEAVFKYYLAQKLQCKVDYIERMGYKTLSAGNMGLTGFKASSEAVYACKKKGIELNKHRSRSLTKQLIDDSDVIFAMTRSHKQRILEIDKNAGNKCMLLAEGMDIIDPVGQGQDVYNECFDIIEEAVKKRIGGLIL